MSHVFSLDQENATAEHNERIPKQHKNRSIEYVTTVHVGENGHHENAKERCWDDSVVRLVDI